LVPGDPRPPWRGTGSGLRWVPFGGPASRGGGYFGPVPKAPRGDRLGRPAAGGGARIAAPCSPHLIPGPYPEAGWSTRPTGNRIFANVSADSRGGPGPVALETPLSPLDQLFSAHFGREQKDSPNPRGRTFFFFIFLDGTDRDFSHSGGTTQNFWGFRGKLGWGDHDFDSDSPEGIKMVKGGQGGGVFRR